MEDGDYCKINLLVKYRQKQKQNDVKNLYTL